MKLVVGLGNPGERYAGTRHNVGFDTVDYLAEAPDCHGFRSRFEARYRELREGPGAPLSDEAMVGFLEAEAGRLRDAAARNFERWPILGEVVLGNPDRPPDSYDGEVEALEGWLRARAAWMDEELSRRP